MHDTILLVEDEANDAFFVKSTFEKVGVATPVMAATHGREAIDYLQGKGEFGNRDKFPLPRLILLDVKLPQVMGLDVLRWIRAAPRVSSTVVLMLTSSDSPADIAAAYETGANAYVVKPTEFDQCVALAEAIRDFWLKANQPCPAAGA